PPAPIAPSHNSIGVWTGTDLVVWSVESACRPGYYCPPFNAPAAAWSPGTRVWRRIASPPAEAARGQQAVTSTGSQVVTVTTTGFAAAYDVAADRWDQLPPVPAMSSYHTALVWTGTQIIYWSTAYCGAFNGSPVGDPVLDRGWQWTPGAGEWQPLPDL